MHCLITAGPTYEPLDQVRRLTNFSTGRLGTELANYLTARGHIVELLLGEQSTCRQACQAGQVTPFSTTADLAGKLQAAAAHAVRAVFHAAAVSDFAFGTIWERSESGELLPVRAGKISSRTSGLVAELVPTPKIIAQLRAWFPQALLVGWKYETDGDRASVLAKAERQLAETRIDACVANGSAYGKGFGLVTGPAVCTHLAGKKDLFEELALRLEGAGR